MIAAPIQVLGFCAAASGAGKTTLLTALIPLLKQQHVRVSLVKHAHHRFDIDQPGKDSYRLREAGAAQTLVASSQRWALMTEHAHAAPPRQEPDLGELLCQLDPALADLVLVEGFRHAEIAKIEVHRPALGFPLLAPQDAGIIAIASDVQMDSRLPWLDLNQPAAVAEFVLAWLEKSRPSVPVSS